MVIHYIFSSESQCVVNSLLIVNSLRVLCLACRGLLEKSFVPGDLEAATFASILLRKIILRKLFSRAAKRGVFQNGGASRSGLVLPFLSFFVLFATFPIFPGFSRFVRGWSRDFPDLSVSSFSAY